MLFKENHACEHTHMHRLTGCWMGSLAWLGQPTHTPHVLGLHSLSLWFTLRAADRVVERKCSISPGAWEWKQRSICWDLKSQSMN